MQEQYLSSPSNYIQTHTDILGQLGDLEQLKAERLKVKFTSRIEGRTRGRNITEALRLRVHDPLWMLARQWQMGEFRGNNAGTAMSVRCLVSEQDCSTEPIEPRTERQNPRLDFMVRVESAVHLLDLVRTDTPLSRTQLPALRAQALKSCPIEWDAETARVLDTPKTAEAERMLNRHLQQYRASYEGRIFDGVKMYDLLKAGATMIGISATVRDKYLRWFSDKYLPTSTGSQWSERDLSYDVTAQAGNLAFHGDRYNGGRLSWHTFDYDPTPESTATPSFQKAETKTEAPVLKPLNTVSPTLLKTLKTAVKVERRLNVTPTTLSTVAAVRKEPLSAVTSVSSAIQIVGPASNATPTQPTLPKVKPVTRQLLTLPTPVSFASAPNKRLWQMEDHKVYLGNSLEQQSEGNVVAMKFATMYANDWMLFPLHTQIGKYIEVQRIEVVDTFGRRTVIQGSDRAGVHEQLRPNQEPWQVFTNTTRGQRGRTDVQGLFFVPQLAATVEGSPIEEVKILRDEMANMVWGVEESVPDGCGGTLDAHHYAASLASYIETLNVDAFPQRPAQTVTFTAAQPGEQNKDVTVEQTEAPGAKYRYLLQTQVPYNWIPFVPQRLETKNDANSPFFLGGREMALRRGKMPCYVYDRTVDDFKVWAVRPLGDIMRPAQITRTGDNYKETPLLINEEAIQATGIRLTRNYQRTRWTNGEVYTWLGVFKRQADVPATSGLRFDELEEK